MKNILNPENLTNEDLKKWLLNVHEKYYIELKKASELQMRFGRVIHHFVIHLEDGLSWELKKGIRKMKYRV